jgi:hypothetical protein
LVAPFKSGWPANKSLTVQFTELRAVIGATAPQ